MAEPLSIPGQNFDPEDIATRDPRDLPAALPEEASPASNPRLNQTAETIGSAMGTTVRELKSRFQVVKGGAAESASSTAAEWKQRAGDTVDQVKKSASEAVQSATNKASEVFDSARQRASEAVANARSKAAQKAEVARRRASYYADEYPVHVALGAAAAGFALGVALRIWRSQRD